MQFLAAGCGSGRAFYTSPPIITTAPSAAIRITSTCRRIARRNWNKRFHSWPARLHQNGRGCRHSRASPKHARAIIYAPLGQTPFAPDVILFDGTPRSSCCCRKRRKEPEGRPIRRPGPRPTCMALPAAIAHGALMSTGCVGNRLYTDLEDGTMYMAIPGKALAAIADELKTIASANAQLTEYHTARRQALSTE